MRSSRGKPSLTLGSNGGAVRTIELGTIQHCLNSSFGENVPETLVSEIYQACRSRIVYVDAPAISVPSDGELRSRLEQISTHAETLLALINRDNALGDLLHEIEYSPSEIGHTNNFIAYLVRLKNWQAYFSPESPSNGYKFHIQKLYTECRDAGMRATVSEQSLFFRFLTDLEAEYPGLIFPKDSAPQYRATYVRRAVQPVRRTPG